MREPLKLRQKIGVVTLALAIAAFFGWGMSYLAPFPVIIHEGKSTFTQISFSFGEIRQMTSEYMKNVRAVDESGEEIMTLDESVPAFKIDWSVSYWPFAFSFAILSAYLILWRGLKREPTQPTQS